VRLTYKEYRNWTETQFSDTEAISFIWLRNFIYLIIAGELFKFCWFVIDNIFDLSFEEDWWWHLLTVFIICYIGIKGYSQPQATKLIFTGKTPAVEFVDFENEDQKTSNLITENSFSDWKPKIEKIMKEDKVFLEPELSLTDMAQKLKTNTSVLSAAINQNFNKNFNDFINEFRIEEFKKQVELPENKHFTKLGVAFDCGFNSKATFNRALKKFG
jgi:AraC-like DNA-binding protein